MGSDHGSPLYANVAFSNFCCFMPLQSIFAAFAKKAAFFPGANDRVSALCGAATTEPRYGRVPELLSMAYEYVLEICISGLQVHLKHDVSG